MYVWLEASLEELDDVTDALNKAFDIANELEREGYNKVQVKANSGTISIKYKIGKEE